jgi:uncharacterized membrane protein
MTKKTGSEVYNIVAFVFADRQEAKRVSDELRHSAKGEGYKVIANAVVEVDEKGKAHVHEAGHGTWGTALGAGGVGLLSLIGGPAGLLAWAVAGGVIGGFAGKFAGRAIPTKDMKELAERMQPNTSAILAMVEDTWAETLINDMAPYKAQVVTLTVGDELSGEIAQAVATQGEAPAEGEAASEGEAPAEDPGKTLSNTEVWQV